jgi:hypothetical protein
VTGKTGKAGVHGYLFCPMTDQSRYVRQPTGWLFFDDDARFDGQTLAGGSIAGAIRLRNPTVNYATHWICGSAGELTSEQWQTYIQELSYQPLCTS